MRKYLISIILIITLYLDPIHTHITWIEARVPLKGIRPAPGTPWPLPQNWLKSPVALTIDPIRFFFTSDARDCDIIDNGLTRYKDIIFMDKNMTRVKSEEELVEMRILVEKPDDCFYPQHNNDESYSIKIVKSSNGPSFITSNTVWGALRGLETFSQLIYQDEQTGIYYINETEIVDWPAYMYRGLLLDTARHFIPLHTLLRNLDAMAYNKFNVFHWHLVDDQAFPFESKKYPQLSEMGAYTPKHVYSQADIKLVIEYARMRGIRVIPELDSPGHTKVLQKAFPQLITPCYGKGPSYPYTPNYPKHSDADILNPIQNETYLFMKELFEEMKDLFPDYYIHLGMDEVYYACWQSNPHIADFMRKNSMNKINEVEQYYVRRTIKNVHDIGYKYLMWQDPVDNDVELAEDAIVQVWKDTELDPSMKSWKEYIMPIAKKGYQMVLSACWYLNYIRYPYPNKDWEKYYLCNPKDFPGTQEEKDLVIGGEACLWGEFVDATNLLSRLWPRASAAAERLWRNPENPDVDSARFRLDQHRCRMVQREIPAAPILNGYCGSYDWDLNKHTHVYAGERIKGN